VYFTRRKCHEESHCFKSIRLLSPRNLAWLLHSLSAIWVDERDLQIARAEFQLIEAFKVGGGAPAAMKPGSRFVTEQDRVNDGIWLPIYDEVSIGARAMLVANLDVKQKFTYGAYRRFDANSEEKLKSPFADK
jgi:hypothetical protein